MTEFKTVPNWETRYCAGSDGLIYSLKTNKPIFQELNPITGRYQVNLWRNGISKTVNVHVLICSAFHIKHSQSTECSHLNGNKLDNKPSNLQWETTSQNLNRRYEHGTDDNGYKNSRSKLTMIQLEEVRNMILNNISYSTISNKFNISKPTITRIKKRERYSKC